MISVVIIDDHPVVRAGLKAVLSTAGDICLAGEGASGADALRLAAALRPDVLVLDLNLPDFDGLEVTRRLAKAATRPAILVLTVHREGLPVLTLLEYGALGYVLKDEALENLVSAVRAVASGQNWLSPAAATQVVRQVVRQGALSAGQTHDGAVVSIPEPLTRRETEILSLLAQGLDNPAIARRLVLTTRTVQNHVSAIYGKLGVSNRTEAALYAIQHGLSRLNVTEE